MKKQTGSNTGADGADNSVIADPQPSGDAPGDAGAAAEGEQYFDAEHEWPSAGGSYVRQGDGTLKRED